MSVAGVLGDHAVLPGLATAHSHAFQRALRGRAQRSRGSFWSWRGQMYQLAHALDPEAMYAVARFAYAELAAAGVTAVGEFHYVHHQADGEPYADRTILADAVIRAALDVGIRISLLRVLYARPGWGGAPEGPQRRFCDPTVDDALRDIEALIERWDSEPHVEIGVAPHSVRACPIEWIEAAHRAFPALPFHAHVSEQPREIHECMAEHGRRPVELLAERGVIDERFVAVHATHLNAAEVAHLSGAFVCICRTTERDLGDGLPPLRDLVRGGARLCFGVDSHAISDPFVEARAAELDERSRTGARCLTEPKQLLNAAGPEGYAAIGMAARETEDRVRLDLTETALVGTPPDRVDDAIVFGAHGGCVDEVHVAGVRIVDGGVHVHAADCREGYLRALDRLATQG